MLPLLAQSDVPVTHWHPTSFQESIISSAAFGALGVILLLFGFLAFDLVTRRLDVQKELAQKNVAVAIVVAGLLIGIALIVNRAIGG